jgi:hypothetical protein
MPPDVPPERLAVMRKALADTFADPQFIAETARLALGPNLPRSGEQIEQVIGRVLAAPPRVLDRLRKLNTVPR